MWEKSENDEKIGTLNLLIVLSDNDIETDIIMGVQNVHDI